MDASVNMTAATPESLLLGAIEDELAHLSEQQHAWARRVAVLRKARTMLHVGCSTSEVDSMLAEYARQEARHSNWAAPTAYPIDLPSVIALSISSEMSLAHPAKRGQDIGSLRRALRRGRQCSRI
jgi:hypothetical protein